MNGTIDVVAVQEYERQIDQPEGLAVYEVLAGSHSRIADFHDSLWSYGDPLPKKARLVARGRNVIVVVDFIVTSLRVVKVPVEEEERESTNLRYQEKPDWVGTGELIVWSDGQTDTLDRVWFHIKAAEASDMVTDGSLIFLDHPPQGY